jgi:hypothetical protein
VASFKRRAADFLTAFDQDSLSRERRYVTMPCDVHRNLLKTEFAQAKGIREQRLWYMPE